MINLKFLISTAVNADFPFEPFGSSACYPFSLVRTLLGLVLVRHVLTIRFERILAAP